MSQLACKHSTWIWHHQCRTGPRRPGTGELGHGPGSAHHSHDQLPSLRGGDPAHGDARQPRRACGLMDNGYKHRSYLSVCRMRDQAAWAQPQDLPTVALTRFHREAVEGATPALDDPRHAAFTEEVKLELLPAPCAKPHPGSGSPPCAPPTPPRVQMEPGASILTV